MRVAVCESVVEISHQHKMFVRAINFINHVTYMITSAIYSLWVFYKILQQKIGFAVNRADDTIQLVQEPETDQKQL